MLICPICQAPLSALDNGVVCAANHRFDRARQGYLNLLPVQHTNSRDPGDNQAMVEARRRFLDGGHYAPLARRLAGLAAERAPQRWLDIGCGEGYYTAQIADALPHADGYALDISRERVQPAGLAGSATPARARRRTAAHGADPRASVGAARAALRRGARLR
jgi:23S rRNA (guanine745-N1)-methyltransferase